MLAASSTGCSDYARVYVQFIMSITSQHCGTEVTSEYRRGGGRGGVKSHTNMHKSENVDKRF